MTISANKRDAASRVALVVAAALVFGSPSLLYPFGFDQANQAQAAAMVLEGAVPFSEVPSLKPPLTIAFHATAIALFGKTMLALRLLDLVWTALTAAAIAACARRVWRDYPGIGVVSGIAYVHTYYCFGFWHSAQTDGWMNLPIAVAVWLVLAAWDSPHARTRQRVLHWGAVGGLTVTALLFKYSAGGFLGLFALAACACFFQGKRTGAVAVASFVGGVLVAVGLLVVTLVILGAWDGFVHDHLVTATRYAESTAPAAAKSSFVTRLLGRVTDLGPAPTMLHHSPKTFWLGAIGGGLLVARAVGRKTPLQERGRLALLLGWLGAAWMSTAVQGRYFGYHFLPLLAPWALFAGLLCVRTARWLRTKVSARALPWVSIPVLGLLFMWANRGPFFYPYLPLGEQFALLGRVMTSETVEEIWLRGPFEVAPNYSVHETVAVVRYLRANSSADDPLLVWGSNHAIYFLADRPRISRITTAYQATGQSVAAGAALGGQQLLVDILLRPPSIVVVQHGDGIPGVLGHNLDSFALLAHAPAIHAYLQMHYRLHSRVGRFDVLKRAVP